MLTPDYYESCVEDILNLYAQLENDIISDVIRRMMKTGFVTESAKHQAEMLQNAGLLYDDILAEISKYTDASSAQVKALFEDAGVRTVNFDNQIYRAVGFVPVDIRQSPAMRQTLEAGYRKTLGNMRNLTLTTANMGQTTYYNACNQAYMKVISGAFSYQEAIKKAVQKTAQDGAFVLYPSGHRDRVDVAVRRSVLTGVGQTCREIGIMNAKENDCDLMELSAHFGARPTHAEWQGQIVSLSGRKGYLSLSDIGYGTGDGFGGWNCRHDWFPYFEGYSRRNYTDSYLKSLNEKNIEYNGEKYSQYEISQIQRKYEREIRSAKREKVAFDTAVKETSDSELKAVMKSGSDYANQQIKEKQAQMRDFIQQTGNKRDYFREQNYGKVIYTKNYSSDFTDKTRHAVKGVFSNEKIISYKELPEHLKAKFENGLKYSEKNTAKILKNALKTADIRIINDRSFYNRLLNVISIQKKCQMGTIAHETFHYIDNKYKVNKKHDLFTPLQKDWEILLKKSNGNVVDYLMEQYPESFTLNKRNKYVLKSEYRAISDIISGLSKDNINLGYHHEKEYWNVKGSLVAESWAQFGRINYENIDKVNKMFSNLFTNFENNAIICLKELI